MNAVQLQAKMDAVPFTNIGVACNQFGMQMPGKNRTEILNVVKHVRPGNGYEPNYPWFGLAELNGANELPLYTFLKDLCPPYQKQIGERARLFYDPVKSGDVTWNFEKFLIDSSGRPVARFHPEISVRAIYENFVRKSFMDTNFM